MRGVSLHSPKIKGKDFVRENAHVKESRGEGFELGSQEELSEGNANLTPVKQKGVGGTAK